MERGGGAGSREDHMGQTDGGEVKAEKKKAMDPDKPKRLLSYSDRYSIKKKEKGPALLAIPHLQWPRLA